MDLDKMSETKNIMIQHLQELYDGYVSLQENLHTQSKDFQTESLSQLDAIKGSETQIQTHMAQIQKQESEIRDLKKQKHEYEEMIRNLQDKLHDTQTKAQEEECSKTRFDMMKQQAKEITEKDREIERLNRLVLLLKKKNETQKASQETSKQLDGGWSPTASKTPRQEEDNNPDVIDTVLSSVSDSVLKLEQEVEQEEVVHIEPEPSPSPSPDEKDVSDEVAEPEVTEPEVTEVTEPEVTEVTEPEVTEVTEPEVTEEVVEEPSEELEVLSYRKKKYIIVTGDTDNNLYAWLEGDKKGELLGKWGTTGSGKRKPMLPKKK
jgi:myosin heavy subunit